MMKNHVLASCFRLVALSVIGCGPAGGTSAVPAAPAPSGAPVIVDVAPPAKAAAPSASVAAEPEATPRQSADAPAPGASRRDADGLVVDDIVVGGGPALTPQRTAIVHYDGTLLDGKRFDSSRDRGRPFEFVFGAGHVIAGWERGLAGMRVGGVRRLEIPAELAYGVRGRPPTIPGGATLVFEVELLAVQ